MKTASKLTRTLSGLAALGLVTSLAACGGNNDNNENNGMDAGVEDMADNNGVDMAGNNEVDMAGNNEVDMAGNNEVDMGPADMGDDAGGDDMGGDDMSGADMGTDMGPMLDGFVIFNEALASDLTFAPFGGSTNAISESQDEAFSGTTSLKVSVPATGYTGGGYVPSAAEDLSSYNALSFQVKASKAATLNSVGFGNTGQDDTQQVEALNIDLTTSWQEVIIPIPNPTLATASSGLFHFAEGSDEGAYDIYFDEIAFVNRDASDFTNEAPAFGSATTTVVVGQTTSPVGTVYNVDVLGDSKSFPVQPFWFDWTSSDDTVATVADSGVVTAVAEGTAVITGSLDGVAAGGQIDLTVLPGPTAAAPTPSTAAGDVEASIFSGAYTNTTVDTYLASFSVASLTQLQVAGDDTLVYGGLDFAGIEMLGANSIDLTSATMLHIDIWTPDAAQLGIKLVDFGADNAYAGGDDSEYELILTSPTDFTTGQWVSLDFPLSTFDAGLNSREHISQIVLSGRVDDNSTLVPGATLFVDNLYFY